MADLRYYLRNRERRLEYNRRYYWLNHERILAQKRWYCRNVRPLRIQFGDLPTDHIDRQMWQRQADRQQAQETATAIFALILQSLTEDERRLLMAIEAHEYDAHAALAALGINENMLRRIRDIASKAKEVIDSEGTK